MSIRKETNNRIGKTLARWLCQQHSFVTVGRVFTAWNAVIDNSYQVCAIPSDSIRDEELLIH